MQLARKSGPAAAKPASQRGWIGQESWDDPDDEEAVDLARDDIFNRLERMRENDEEKKLAAGWARDGEDWVPPGYVGVMDLEALPVADGEPGRKRRSARGCGGCRGCCGGERILLPLPSGRCQGAAKV